MGDNSADGMGVGWGQHPLFAAAAMDLAAAWQHWQECGSSIVALVAEMTTMINTNATVAAATVVAAQRK